MGDGWDFLWEHAKEPKGMTDGDWITLIALCITIIIGVLGYFKNPSFVSTGRLRGLREQISALESENERLKKEVAYLGETEWQLRRDASFWQDQYRRISTGKSPSGE